MKNIKLTHVLFSLALVAALVLAAVPAAPVYALPAGAGSSAAAFQASTGSTSQIVPGAWVCRSITVWRHGHRITIRRCHRVHVHGEQAV